MAASSPHVRAASVRSTRSACSSRLSRPAAVCRSKDCTTCSRSSSEARNSGAFTSITLGPIPEEWRRVVAFGGTVHGVATPTPGKGLLVIERILRDRPSIWQQIVDERDLRQLIGQMVGSTVVSLALYGAVLGASHGWQQMLSSMVKLPLLFLATLAICLPTLYLFNLVFGSRLSMVQAVALILVSITVTAVLTLAFAPVSLFFLVTAKSYSFYKLLNVLILLLTALVGLRFLVEGMRAVNDQRSVAPVHATAEIAMVPRDGERLCPTAGAQDHRRDCRRCAGRHRDHAPATATVPPGPRILTGASGSGRDAARPGSAARRATTGQHDPALHLDRALRVRRYPARLDAAPVLRRSRVPLRGLPGGRWHLLRRCPQYDRPTARRVIAHGSRLLPGEDHSGSWLRSQSAQVMMPRRLPGWVSNIAAARSVRDRGSGNGSGRRRCDRNCRH